MQSLPAHLQKYIVQQELTQYTARDHAVWRYILRQLKNFLGQHAHESYLEGLEKTGISIDQIPRISDISQQLEKFGWRALPVSGFIPPAAFMELQSLSILPIASDMRSIDHLLYTPAPDIVHEAAGHAPILADPEYAAYLKAYAQIAKKALISKEDIELYKAIRELSDIKEDPNSTVDEIKNAEKKLEIVSKAMTFTSEAAELSRMNWWTAEYGLVGRLDQPKIFGAGLLSSVGESKWCLSEKVKKIPLTVDCIRQTYDITEPQPQLFVAESFAHLNEVLQQFAQTMSYQKGGEYGLKKAIEAETVNTVEFENKLQISGQLKNYRLDQNKNISFVQFQGPTQICFQDQEIQGHSKKYHSQGYSTPLGSIKNSEVLNKLNEKIVLSYSSGFEVSGVIVKKLILNDSAALYTFDQATCRFGDEILFKPEWGLYDIAIGAQVVSVFGGPADRNAFGEVEDFVAARVQKPHYTNEQLLVFEFYQKIQNLRQTKSKITTEEAQQFVAQINQQAPAEWLLYLEILELATKQNLAKDFIEEINTHLKKLGQQNQDIEEKINEGLKLIYATH